MIGSLKTKKHPRLRQDNGMQYTSRDSYTPLHSQL